MSIKAIEVKIDPKKVYLLRFILEGYDNLFVLSTLDKKLGIVKIDYCHSEGHLLWEILEEIGPEIGLDGMKSRNEIS